MPTLEPWVAGFTASGSPSSATARSKSAAPASSTHGGVATPAACASRLVRSLSMPIAEPITPLPVYGTPSHSSAPCRAPSSPPGPCSATKARSNPSVTSSPSARAAGSNGAASTPRATSASVTALPVISEISRSAESPPSSTATRPNSAATAMRLYSTPVARSRLIAASPMTRTSGTSFTPCTRSTVAWTWRTSASRSAAVASPSLRMKFACLSETAAPPIRNPLSPARSISSAAWPPGGFVNTEPQLQAPIGWLA